MTVVGVIVALTALQSHALRAQGPAVPPPPPRIATGTAAVAQPAQPAPLILPAAPSPPAPPKTITPASALPPKDSAVALCNNGTFVMLPGTPADCASRGGLRVAMPPRAGPVVRRATTSQSVRPSLVEQGPPAGATMRCKDGTYLTGTPAADRCANNGGVAAIIPARAPASAQPAAQKRP
jgi:hypothetical protein